MHRSPLNSRGFFLELFNFGLYELVGEDVWEVLTNIGALRIAQDSQLWAAKAVALLVASNSELPSL